MSVYQSHKRHKRELNKAILDYSEVLEKKMELFAKTQPSSVPLGKEGKSSPGSGTDTIDAYLIACEETGIDARLKASRELINHMKERLKDDEDLLRMSAEVVDRVYILYVMERRSVPDIASLLHYTQSNVYKYVREIEKV